MAKPNMSRNQDLAGQSVQQGSYVVTYDADGYATSAKKGTGGAVVSTPTTTTTTSQTTDRVSQDIKTPTVSSGSYVAADPGGTDNYHAKNTANEGKGMSASDLATLESFGAAWNDADAKQKEAAASGQTALADYYQSLKNQAHEGAEALRQQYGYSGGADGSQYIADQPSQIKLPTTPTGKYDLSEYLKQASAAQIEAELAGLKDAYEKSMAGYDAKLDGLPQTYDAARNNVAAQDAIARKSFDERAAASGLSSGAGGQVELARSSAYQRDIANIDQEQANAVSEIELAKANLQTQYENAIAAAVATNNMNLANALYQELIRVQGLEREDAQLAAAQEAAAQELALKYGLTISDSYAPAETTQTVETPAVRNPSPAGKGYDNGSLTADQIKTLQAHYGLAQDGMWGPNSQATTGMGADEAWTQYLYEKYSADPAPAAGTQDGSAYWTSGGYSQVSNDVQDLVRAGESATVIAMVIEAAKSGNQITEKQADQLRAQYVK